MDNNPILTFQIVKLKDDDTVTYKTYRHVCSLLRQYGFTATLLSDSLTGDLTVQSNCTYELFRKLSEEMGYTSVQVEDNDNEVLDPMHYSNLTLNWLVG